MPLVGLPPAFVPPVVAVPAANAIVPFVAGTAAAGGGAAVASAVAAPLLVGALAGVAVLGIAYGVAQLWGALNQVAETPPGYVPTSPTAYTAGTARAPSGVAGQFTVVWVSPDVYPTTNAFSFPAGVVGVTATRHYYEGMPWPGTTGTAYRVTGWDSSGVVVSDYFFLVGAAPGYALWDGPTVPSLRLESVRYFFTPVGQPAVEIPLAPVGTATRTAPEPKTLPEPAKAPPVVVPLPYAPPAAPEAKPTREPTPARPARPVVAPPVTRPAPVAPAATPRTTTPTTTAGQVQPTPQLPPVQTPTTVHVVNGTPIPANGPQATPQGIAQELGRIESKLARLLNPNPRGGPDLTDRLGLIWSAIQAIAEIINSASAGGEYRINSPCVLDENGQRIDRVVEFDGALTAFGVLQNRIDALAALLQEHKDLKQPICRETPATGGQAVTVNFVQID